MLKKSIRAALRALGYELKKVRPPADCRSLLGVEENLYQPLYSPWLGESFQRAYAVAAPRTLVSAANGYVLHCLARQALRVKGDFWECGVYKGGTATLLSALLRDHQSPKQLHLFDTFSGMPATDQTKDFHQSGDFGETSLESVREFLSDKEHCVFHPGLIPASFAGLESASISLAHVDVDIYQSVRDSLEFVWPRLSPGGFIVCDDYGFPTCPGARQAVDEYFASQPVVPLCLATGQAIVFKSGE